MLKVIPHLQFLDQVPLTAEAAKQGYLVSQSSLLRYVRMDGYVQYCTTHMQYVDKSYCVCIIIILYLLTLILLYNACITSDYMSQHVHTIY